MIDSSLLTFLPTVTRLRECPVMFISDCPLANEISNKEGYSSQKARIEFAELAKIGIPRTAIHATYLFNFRPEKGELSSLFWNKSLDSAEGYVSWGNEKNCFILDYAYHELQRLKEEIKTTKPEIIVISGRWSLFFLTALTKSVETKKSTYGTLMKWRASSLELSEWWEYQELHIVFPMLPIDSRYTLPDVQYLIKWDLERLKHMYKGLLDNKLLPWKIREENFIVPSSNANSGNLEFFNICVNTLHKLLNMADQHILYLSIDVETIAKRYIDCLSIAWSASEAICIPFASLGSANYWVENEEIELYSLIRELFLHKNVRHIGQNYSYDMQYFWRNMLMKVAPEMDTMIMGHVMFSTMEKNLGFLSSLYCKQHYWWKDEGKIGKDTTNLARWIYNCKDTSRTYEIAFKQKEMFDNSSTSLQEALRFQTFDNLPTITNVMNRGIRQDESLKLKLIDELETKAKAIANEFQTIFDEPVNINSSEQLKGIFYELFKCKKYWNEVKDSNGNTKNVLTLDEDSLKSIYSDEVLLRPIINILLDYKKLSKTASGLKALTLDVDGRLRCSYNVCGTDTYRYSSNSNAFGSGTNLQVISKGKKLRNGTPLPNSKKLFLPDPGMTYFDIDLTAADAHIVAWESNCKELQEFMLAGEDLYLTIAKEYYRNPNLVKESPERQQFKGIIHGCLTEDHEILTKDGWISISKYTNEDIAVWNKDTWDITFENPRKYHIYELENNTLVEIEGSALSQLVTTNHKIPYTTDDREIIFSKEVIDLPKSASIPYVGFYSGNIVENENYIKLIAALQADGHIQYTSKDGVSNYSWHLGKERKINRLISILSSLNIPYTYISKEESSDGYVRIYFKGYLEDYMKYPGKWLLNYCQNNLFTYVNELLHWDGSVDNSNSTRVRLEVSTISKESAEWMQTIIQLTGHGSKITVSKNRVGNRQDLYRVSINNRKFHKCKNGKFNLVNNFTGKVYCFTTSTGFFLIRRKGHISITGNSNYAGSAKGLAERFNLLVHEVDRIQKYYFGRFPEVKQSLTRLEQEVRRTKRITNIFGFQRWFFNLNIPTLIQTAAAWRPQCLSKNHNVITNKGLVPIADITVNDLVASWNIDTKEIHWSNPLQIHKGISEIFKVEGMFEHEATSDHTLPYTIKLNKVYRSSKLKDLRKIAKIPSGGFLNDIGENWNIAKAEFLAAYQADGWYDSTRNVFQFEFKKERKIDKLEEILFYLKAEYTKTLVRRGATMFYIRNANSILNPDYKESSEFILNIGSKAIQAYVNAIKDWDGHYNEKTGVVEFNSTRKSHIDYLKILVHLYGGIAREYKPDTRSGNPIYRLNFNFTKTDIGFDKSSITNLGLQEVYCITTNSGYFLTELNGKISVTGNSTVATIINKGMVTIDRTLPDVQVLMQTHDSLSGQFPTNKPELKEEILKACSIELPYAKPLIIPVNIETSKVSWGDI